MPLNNQSIRFVNENVRPRAELLRKLKALTDSDLQTWAAISSNFSVGTEPVDDGRDGEGVSRLTCQDVTNFMTVMQALQNRLNQAGTAAIIEKPCVRALEVS